MNFREQFLIKITEERGRQIRKWGDKPVRLMRPERVDLSGDILCMALGVPTESAAKSACDVPHPDAADILLEEVVEAIVAIHKFSQSGLVEDGEAAIAELVQVGALSSKIAETIHEVKDQRAEVREVV